MRDRPWAVPRRQPLGSSDPAPDRPRVIRRFHPTEIDIDELADAVRLLLADETRQANRAVPGRPDSDLLSVCPGGMNVWEEAETP
jgi:hypothetical protein